MDVKNVPDAHGVWGALSFLVALVFWAHKKTGWFALSKPACFVFYDAFIASLLRCLGCLKDIQDEVMAAVVGLLTWVEVVPVFVVNRDSHRRSVAVVHVVILLRLLEVVGIVDVRVVVEPLPVRWLSRRSCLRWS